MSAIWSTPPNLRLSEAMASHGPFSMLGRVLFWRYPRGGWQYDLLCAVILVFIFMTPRSVFDGSYFAGRDVADPKATTTPESSSPAQDLEESKTPPPASPTGRM